jgi:catalase
MTGINPEIQRRQIQHFLKADPEYGSRIAQQLNLKMEQATGSR